MTFIFLLRHHVRTEINGITRSVPQEIVETLENMEALTLKCLKKIVADIAEVT